MQEEETNEHMEKSAIYHRPESEFAYLYNEDTMHIRLRTKKDDVLKVTLYYVDPYLVGVEGYSHALDMEKVASGLEYDYWQVEVSVEFRRIQYVFRVTGLDLSVVLYGDLGVLQDSDDNFKHIGNYFRLPYFHDIDRFKSPEWVKETVWYQIFPERFANGNPEFSPANTLEWDSTITPKHDDFFGGDLQGVYDQLDYLQDLGINGLYFCPIFEAATNHKYDTIDYFEIDKHFGDKQLFKQLIDEAHRRGMRVMLDAVFNHIGSHSSEWQDVIEKGAESKYADWFHIREFPVSSHLDHESKETFKELNYDTFAFSPNMPKLNTANPEVKAYLLDIATYWIREFDIDGWRLDVANEVDHRFWKEFNRQVLAIKPDLYILGEIWHSSRSWLVGDEFHAVMNYAFTGSINQYFLQEQLGIKEFISRLYEQQMMYRRQTNEVMFNLLDSHDTQRILTTAQGDKDLVKAALAFMFLQMGTPCIYYGTEYGLAGGPDPDCRRVMPWNPDQQDTEMFAFMKDLIALRKAYNKLIVYGQMNLMEISSKSKFLRLEIDYQGQMLNAIFNNDSQDYSLRLSSSKHILLGNGYNLRKDEVIVEPNGFIIFK